MLLNHYAFLYCFNVRINFIVWKDNFVVFNSSFFVGAGKTTVVIKICELLANARIPLTGFYTKELRSGNSRTGFDIFTVDNKHGPLARM